MSALHKFNSKEKEEDFIEISGMVSPDTVDEFSSLKGKKKSKTDYLIVSSILLLLVVSIVTFSLYAKFFLVKPANQTDAEISEVFQAFSASYDDGAYMKVENISEDTSRLFNIPTGIKILKIEENTPPFNTGLRVNDIIVEFDGRKIFCINDIKKRASELSSEETPNEILLKVYRNGSYIEMNFNSAN